MITVESEFWNELAQDKEKLSDVVMISLPALMMDTLFFLSGGVSSFYIYVDRDLAGNEAVVHVWADSFDFGVCIGGRFQRKYANNEKLKGLYGKVEFDLKAKLSLPPGRVFCDLTVESLGSVPDSFYFEIWNAGLKGERIMSTPTADVLTRFSRLMEEKEWHNTGIRSAGEVVFIEKEYGDRLPDSASIDPNWLLLFGLGSHAK